MCQYCGHKSHIDKECGHKTPCGCGNRNCTVVEVCHCKTISWKNSEIAKSMAAMSGDDSFLNEPPV